MSIVKIIFIVVGVACLGVAAHQVTLGGQSKSWAITKGVIISSYVDGVASNAPHSGSNYMPNVKYKFQAEGADHVGDKVSLGATKSYSKKSMAKKVTEKYPVKKIVTVYYEPMNPQNSVIETGADYPYIVMFVGAGLAMLFVGVFSGRLLGFMFNRNQS